MAYETLSCKIIHIYSCKSSLNTLYFAAIVKSFAEGGNKLSLQAFPRPSLMCHLLFFAIELNFV